MIIAAGSNEDRRITLQLPKVILRNIEEKTIIPEGII